MLENINVLIHSSIRITGQKKIYIDPFKIDEYYCDADFIFITHDHYDHYSEGDIDKVRKSDTVYVVPSMLSTKLLKRGVPDTNIVPVEPNRIYNVDEFKFETIPAYNIGKPFHPKENGWVGYIIETNGLSYYIAGDTDITDESKKVKCDIALLPVGGTYTMNASEAAELANIIKPKVAVPIHYGDIVGSNDDAEMFKYLLNAGIEGEILIK